jgi:aryl-alcohol dehydrogenase-like predicted oxidoreductase
MSSRLKNSRLHFSRIGLGCVTFGREIDLPASFAMMDHAVQRGIRFFDTAAAYAGGASERLVGQWYAARALEPGAITIATKILPPYSAETITSAIRASMERLAPAPVDLLFLHRWDETATRPETLRALDALVQSGQVGAIGISNVTTAQLTPLLETQRSLGLARFAAVQNNNNFAVRDVDEPMRQACQEHGVAIVTYSPLGAGFLTGKYRATVPTGTRFDVIPGHQRVYFHDAGYRALGQLERIAARAGRSQTEVALAWALHQPGISTVLVGGRTPAQLEQAFAALSLDDPALFTGLAGN